MGFTAVFLLNAFGYLKPEAAAMTWGAFNAYNALVVLHKLGA